ncbi:MAG: EfeM/EfeO family lipoprotein [Thermomicrobiales bacterium]
MIQTHSRRTLLSTAGKAAAGAAILTAWPRAFASAQDASATPAPIENGAAQVTITLTNDNGGSCVLDYATAPAGPITFTVVNQSATSLTEVELLSENRILGEKENLAPGLPSVSFTVTLGGGTYQIYCPGASTEMQDFVVTGEAAAQPTGSTAQILQEGTTGYAAYVIGVVDAMVDAVAKLKADIDAGNLDAAKVDYPLARPFYERIESDVEGFILPGHDATDNAGNLDYLIDMRESNLDPAVGWHGFHAIEKDLFQDGAITDSTKQLAAELAENVATLKTVVATLTYTPEDLANGAASLLEEVQANKITGEEELYSHYDLVDFSGNVEGAEQAFAFLKPGLEKIDPALTDQVQTQFDKVNALLDTYRDPNEPGGFKLYTDELKATEATKLSQAVQALQEPLSQIAEKVATAS